MIILIINLLVMKLFPAGKDTDPMDCLGVEGEKQPCYMACQRLIEEPLSLGIKTISSTLNFITRRLKQRMIVFPNVWATKSNSEHLLVFFPLRRTEVVVVQGRHRIPFKVRMPTLKSGPFSTTPAHQDGDTATVVCLEKTIKKQMLGYICNF